MKTVGMDLGTSNSYIYAWDDSTWGLGGRPAPVVFPDISDEGGSIATAVLYENGKPLCIGNLAESEYFAHPNLAAKRKFLSQFKPEIARGEAWALEAMEDFLALLRASMPEDILDGATVYVGIPARVREDFAISLGGCFQKAGWPEISFVREPDAALISCLDLGILTVAEIGSRCLILDFGGGTFDYTAIQSLDVLAQGGDALYGGRLFDDLFYQLFCARNADFASAMPGSPFRYYAHWVECKKQKELFSNLVGADEKARASLLLPWYDQRGARHEAWIGDYGRDAFIGNAEHHAASPGLLEILAAYRNSGGLGSFAQELLAGKEIALIGWLHNILENVADRGLVEKVVLTGGSSRWFFVGEAARRFFPAASVVQSSRDNEDIAYGLALYPALAAARAKARELLDSRLEAFCARETAMARKAIAGAADSLISAAAERIAARDIMPALEEAAQNGATLNELEEAIGRNIREDADLAALCHGGGRRLAAQIRKALDEDLKKWLAENGVPLTAGLNLPDGAVNADFFASLSENALRPEDLDNFLLTRLAPAIVGLSTAGLIAHSLEPLSTIAGGGAAFGGTWLLGKFAPYALRNRKIPAFMLAGRARPKIAAKIKGHLEEHLRKTFAKLEGKLSGEIEKRLRLALETMIANLGIFNQIVVS